MEIIRLQGVISEDQVGEIVAAKINEIYTKISGAGFVPGIDQVLDKRLSTRLR